MTSFHSRKIAAIKTAKNEAKRFIKKADAAILELESDHCYPSKEHASAKRASMDLTRSLVFVRMPL